jgi:hypothetical protein
MESNKKKLHSMALESTRTSGNNTINKVKNRMAKEFPPVILFLKAIKLTTKMLKDKNPKIAVCPNICSGK